MNLEIFNKTGEDLGNSLCELEKLLKDFCKRENLNNVLFNIIIVDEEEIQKINKAYRGIDKSTDVISFALEDEESMITPDKVRVLGDIYICIEKVKSQAEEYQHSFKRELTFLAVHGLLHLLGYDHMNKEDEIKMFTKQEEVLNYYGITR